MKPKTMVLMIVAVVCGLGASYMTSRLLAERQQEQEAPMIKVLFAKNHIPSGTVLTNAQALFEERDFPQGKEPKDALVAPEQLKGKYLRKPVLRGYPVKTTDLGEEAAMLPIPEGHRAYGLRGTLVSTVAGFASVPGSKIDLILTTQQGGQKDTYSQVILEDVLVLAADGIKEQKTDGNAIPATVVTLALTPDELLKVSVVEKAGTFTFALRRPGEGKSATHNKVTLESALGNTNSKRAEKEEEKTPPPPVVVPETTPQQEPQFETRPNKVSVSITEGDKVRTVTYFRLVNEDFIREDLYQEKVHGPLAPTQIPINGGAPSVNRQPAAGGAPNNGLPQQQPKTAPRGPEA